MIIDSFEYKITLFFGANDCQEPFVCIELLYLSYQCFIGLILMLKQCHFLFTCIFRQYPLSGYLFAYFQLND